MNVQIVIYNDVVSVYEDHSGDFTEREFNSLADAYAYVAQTLM